MSETQERKPAKAIAKITMKTIGANPKVAAALNEGDKTAIRLAIIFGVAQFTKDKEDKSNGQVFTYIGGNFEAINLQDGESFTSGVLYLPGGIHELLQNAVETGVKANNGEPVAIAFGLEMRAVRSANKAGYSYQGVPVVKPQDTDPLEQMRNAMMSAIESVKSLPEAVQKALPAPQVIDVEPEPAQAKPKGRR